MKLNQLGKILGFGTLLLIICSFSTEHFYPSTGNSNTEIAATWIDTVMLHSQLREEDADFDLHEGTFFLDDIDPSFFKRHLVGLETDYPSKWKVEFDPVSSYYFFDYQHFDSWISFTILQNTERGYRKFFTYTYDAELNKITGVSCIAQSGANSKIAERSYVSSTEAGKKVTVRTHSLSDEILTIKADYDYCFARTSDSTVCNFQFFHDRTEFSIETVVSKLDTICL